MSAQVDELEVAMNRAAEKAAGEATPVFVDAIQKMTFQDASGIVTGGDTAATDYFQKTTSKPLSERFRPIVDQAMTNVGLATQYDQLVGTLAPARLARTDLGSRTADKTSRASSRSSANRKQSDQPGRPRHRSAGSGFGN
jgi:hypothetical protein